MKTRILGIFLLIVVITMFGACADKEKTESTDNDKLISSEADKLVKEKLVSAYKEMGIVIDEYKVSDVKLVQQVPYSKGGTFDFYEIKTRLKPEKPEKIEEIQKRDGIKLTCDKEGWIVKNSSIGEIYISAYNNGKKPYEFLWLREKELPRTKKGQLDFNAFIEYRYEQIQPVKIEDEYTFKINDMKVSIGHNYKGKFPLNDAEISKSDPGDLMRGFTRYRQIFKTKELCAETYCYFEKHYEPVLRMITTNPKVQTARGISVGNSKDELFKAYGEDHLVFSSKNFGGEWFSGFAEEQKLLKDNENWTCFGFTGEDDTQNYIAFYMNQGKVEAIEMGTGFDHKPFKKEEAKYPLEVDPFINDHIDVPDVMKYDVELPKIKDSVNGSENLNALIQLDFDKIIEYSQSGKYEPDVNNYSYPWVEINYSISNLNEVAVLNIFTRYSSAAGSGSCTDVKSYYYDTTCGARLSEEAALFKLGYSKENIIEYFKFFWEESYKEYGDESKFYFDKTGEPIFVVYQCV